MDQQYFSAQPSSKRRTRQIEVTLDGETLTFQTDSGVFSPGRLDLGSATLLRLAPPPPPDAAVLVDLGAGWGPLSVALARRTPTGTVWAVEPNDRARELCAINAQRLAPGRIRTVGPDGGPDAPIDRTLRTSPPTYYPATSNARRVSTPCRVTIPANFSRYRAEGGGWGHGSGESV